MAVQGKHGIGWTQMTWNFLRGCSLALMPGPDGKLVLREGCRFCYARDTGGRFSGPGLAYEGLVIIQGGSAHWTGKVDFAEDHLLDPLRKKKPSKIFVNSMSDLFHPNAKREWVDLGFAVMLLCPQHTFQSLTKRPDLQRDYINDPETPKRIATALLNLGDGRLSVRKWMPLFDAAMKIERELSNGKPLRELASHIHLGCSIEDQASADYVLPIFLQTKWGMLWLSVEPLLGPIDFSQIVMADGDGFDDGTMSWGGGDDGESTPGIGWCVCGGESGPKARPMHPDWARSIRDQCVAAGVPFFFKQFGQWSPIESPIANFSKDAIRGERQCVQLDGTHFDCALIQEAPTTAQWMEKVGKKAAGRLLDGKEWSQYPDIRKEG